MSELELQILTALREHMVAGVMLIDKLIDMPSGSEIQRATEKLSNLQYVPDAGCQHPEDKRVDTSTMGNRCFHCKVCNEFIEVKGL